jgi:hypothetical protein
MPSFFFRIEPIRELELQDEHPGTFNCTLFSAADAEKLHATMKLTTKIKLNIFLDIFLFTTLAFHISYAPPLLPAYNHRCLFPAGFRPDQQYRYT